MFQTSGECERIFKITKSNKKGLAIYEKVARPFYICSAWR